MISTSNNKLILTMVIALAQTECRTRAIDKLLKQLRAHINPLGLVRTKEYMTKTKFRVVSSNTEEYQVFEREVKDNVWNKYASKNKVDFGIMLSIFDTYLEVKPYGKGVFDKAMSSYFTAKSINDVTIESYSNAMADEMLKAIGYELRVNSLAFKKKLLEEVK